MASTKTNKQLHIDKESLATLALAQGGFLGSIDKLMNKKEATSVNQTGYYKGCPFPFSFIMAPNGAINQKNIIDSKKGDILDLIVENKKVGHINVDDSFPINKQNRLKNIFGIFDESHVEIKNMLAKFGDYAVSGHFKVQNDNPKKQKEKIDQHIKELNAKKITGIMLGTRVFNRAHERLIRTALEKADLLVLFLKKPYETDGFSFELRHKVLQYFIDNYLPRHKVLIVPLENSYIFTSKSNLILQCIVAASFGCTKLVISHNHNGISMYYDKNQPHFALDCYKYNLPLEVVIVSEYVFCNECKTLVSTFTCPHGSHHHIKYHGDSLQKLLLAGLLPPALFVRRDISAMILSELFPDRFENVEKLYDNLLPNKGLLESHSQRDFYEELMKLHQTSSMV